MRKEMLKAAKMPPAKKEAADDDMLSMEGMEDDEAAAEPGAGEESPAEEAKELKAMPDEVLLDELKRRGYSVESEEEEKAEGEESPEVVSPAKKSMGMPAAKMPAP